MASTNNNTPNLRTPTELVIKTVTTHLVVIANYAYLSNLLRRPTNSKIHAFRILFFAFVPTLLLVELGISLARTLIQFIRNKIDEDDTNARFYISASLGMHGSLSQSDDDSKNDRSHNLPLLQLNSTLVERETPKINWVWGGKLIVSLFALTQGVGTVVMYGRRLSRGSRAMFGFDHRNGWMGIASAISSVMSIIILLMRCEWKVSRSFHAPTTNSSSPSSSKFAGQAVIALWIYILIATNMHSENRWMYSSGGMANALLAVRFWSTWQTVMLVIFGYVFRNDIATRLGIDSARIERFVKHKSWNRVRLLLGLCLAIWMGSDIIWLLVFDIWTVCVSRHDASYWWQDPVSDRILVL